MNDFIFVLILITVFLIGLRMEINKWIPSNYSGEKTKRKWLDFIDIVMIFSSIIIFFHLIFDILYDTI